jgi:hypothetical protein
MLLYGVLSALCLIVGFGLGLYESDLRWQIVEAIEEVRPDLDAYATFLRARAFWGSEAHVIYRKYYPDRPLLRWHRAISVAAVGCFLAFAVLLVIAIKRS